MRNGGLDDPRDDKMTEWQLDAAHKAFDGHRKLISDSFTMVGSFANTAMRAPAIAAGAGLLGFFSANKNSLLGTDGITLFNSALFYFCSCIAVSVVCPGLAYLSQLFITNGLSSHGFNYQSPFVRPTKRSKIYDGFGTAFQLLATALGLSSIALLLIGGWYFIQIAGFLARMAPSPTPG